ncbi:MAG: signal recognition particle-docking protein FtsY [Epulopiscium sp.]|nr:signal recognition particle-docking protein FtsY [Candidatus Epulonipiscium sp.]
MNFFKKLFKKEPKKSMEGKEEVLKNDVEVNNDLENNTDYNDFSSLDKSLFNNEEVISKKETSEMKLEESFVEIQSESKKTEEKQSIEKITTEKENEELEEPKKKGFFSTLVKGLTKTRENILGGVDQVLKSFQKIDEELFEELEEALIVADIGVSTTMKIIEILREEVKKQKITEAEDLKQILAKIIANMLEDKDTGTLNLDDTPLIILVIGVNGVGKTTTIGKLAYQIKNNNKKVLLAAADTFRAAAIDQLKIWGDRTGVDVIHHQEGSDPGAVIYDAIQAAKSRKTDVLICDTAGRLHNKKNLMEELKKLFRIINREYPEARKEVLLVLDSTTGQNALQQAKLFQEVADITGIILTKLDGTAKGGIVLSIKSELDIPVRYIGVGEGIDDLQPFNPTQFSQALFQHFNNQ